MLGRTRENTLPSVGVDYAETVVPGYTRHTFKEHFRMFPETFEAVLECIGPALSSTTTATGRKPIPAGKQLLLALWFMATPDSYRSVCTRFGVGKATAHRAVRRVTYALYCIAPRFIKWPRGDAAVRTIQLFQQSQGFPGVIGAIVVFCITVACFMEIFQYMFSQKM